jgi:predicted PurR-regulated permease PerM
LTDQQTTAGYHDVVTGRGDPDDGDAGAARVQASSAPELRSLLTLMAGVVVVAALYLGHEVLVPIVLAMLLSFVLSPLVTRLQRLGLWRVPSVLVTVIAALAVIGGIGTVIGTQAASLAADVPRYAQTIQTKIEGAQGFATQKMGSLSHLFGGEANRGVAARTPATAGANAGAGLSSGAAKRPPVPVEVVNDQTSSLSVVRSIVSPVLAPLETLALVLIVAIFILMQREDLRDRFIRLFGSRDLHRTTLAMDDAGQRLSRYFVSQLCVNAGFGLVIGVGTWLIGVPAPALWGLLAGLLRFVPYIGAILAAVAPVALGAAIDPGWGMSIEVALLFAVAEPITGYAIEPMLYGHSTGLSPISVIVAAIFWTWAWGPIGLILSTPLTLCLVVLGRHVKSLEFFDVLLGDRPALTPEKSFYQRILAGNPDEALAHAEQMLADRPLAAYYDDVVVPALRLAAEDAARGSVDPRRAADIRRAAIAVVDDLADHADPALNHASAAGEPAAAASVSLAGVAVACVTGPGPFDGAVAAMLAQLVERAGGSLLRVRHSQVQRDTVAALDLSGMQLVAIAALDAAGTPPALRYLQRRLRPRAKDAVFVIGPSGSVGREEPVATTAVPDGAAGTLTDMLLRMARVHDEDFSYRP